MDGAAMIAYDARASVRASRTGMLVRAAGVAALTAGAGALGASGSSDHDVSAAVLRALIVGAPLAAGWYAAQLEPYRRFADLLALTGVVSFVSVFAESSNAWLYSSGRVAGWALEVVLVLVALAFPTGRLAAGPDRRLVLAMLSAVGLFYLPTVFLAQDFKVPSPYTSCVDGCPPNAFLPFHPAAAEAADLLRAVGTVLVFLIMIGVLVRLNQRAAESGQLERSVLLPVIIVASARVTLVGTGLVGRDVAGARDLAEVTAPLIAWLTPCIAGAFLFGVMRSRLYGERALRQLAMCVGSGPDVATLERAFSSAFDDSGITIVFPHRDGGERWIDGRGRNVPLAGLGARQSLHLVHGRHHAVVAALVCDQSLTDRPELLHAATQLTSVALENLRLSAAAEAAVVEAQASRARIAAAADRERRRIERDLHDGAQQRLVALRIELGLIEDLAIRDPSRMAQRIHDLEDEVDDTLEELRTLAHGVCPPLLADRGLAEALQATAAHSPVPVSLEFLHLGRYATEVETAVYFSVLEALQNVAKHAADSRRAVVRLVANARGDLRFSVSDDGPGASREAFARGRGVTNMRDRVAAVGGEFTVTSKIGGGTVVQGRVPIPVASRRPVPRRHDG